MFRWLHAQKISADFLIAYSCWIPEDIMLQDGKTDLGRSKIVYTYGLDDPFINKERVAMITAIIKKNKLDLELRSYNGDHRVSKIEVQAIWEGLIAP